LRNIQNETGTETKVFTILRRFCDSCTELDQLIALFRAYLSTSLRTLNVINQQPLKNRWINYEIMHEKAVKKPNVTREVIRYENFVVIIPV
jgi:hypothetical protein